MEEWWGQRVAAMASEDREVEEELARREYRTELECKSRTDLQSLAKDYGIPANLKSNVIIDGILHWEYDDMALDEILMCAETMEVVRSLMKKINVRKQSTENAAKWIVDCVMKVEAEMNAFAVKPAAQVFNTVPSGKVAIPSVSSCATAVKAVPVIGIAAKPVTNKHVGVKSEPAVVKAVQQVDMEPVDVKSEPSTGEPSLESTSIFVGPIPRDWTDEKLQCFADVYLLAEGEGVARIIKRYHAKAKKGHAEIQIPKEHKFGDELDDGFVLESKVTGLRFRVAKWQSKTPPHRVPAVATNRRKSEMAVKARQERKSEKSSPRAESEAVKQARKEQARFVADLLHAQAAPNVRRLYSQVISNTAETRMKSMETAINVVSNKVEARMKSMETAMYDVKQLLKRMSSREASTRATVNPAAIHGGERV